MIHHSTQSAFTTVRLHGESYPRILFDHDNLPQNPRQDLGRFLPENRINQARQTEQYPIPRQDCTSQRITDQVEMDTKIAHR